MTDEILSSGLLEILSDFIVLGILLMCFIEKLIQVIKMSGKNELKIVWKEDIENQ